MATQEKGKLLRTIRVEIRTSPKEPDVSQLRAEVLDSIHTRAVVDALMKGALLNHIGVQGDTITIYAPEKMQAREYTGV